MFCVYWLFSWVLWSLGCCMLWECSALCSLKGSEACGRPGLGSTSFCLDRALQLCRLVHRQALFFFSGELSAEEAPISPHTDTAQCLTSELPYFSFSFGILFSRHVLIQTFGITASQETDVASDTFLGRLLPKLDWQPVSLLTTCQQSHNLSRL